MVPAAEREKSYIYGMHYFLSLFSSWRKLKHHFFVREIGGLGPQQLDGGGGGGGGGAAVAAAAAGAAVPPQASLVRSAID